MNQSLQKKITYAMLIFIGLGMIIYAVLLLCAKMSRQDGARILRQAERGYVTSLFFDLRLIIFVKSETEEISTQMLDDVLKTLMEEMHNDIDSFRVLTTGQYNMTNNLVFINMDCSLWKRWLLDDDWKNDPVFSSTIAVCMFSDSTKEFQYVTLDGHLGRKHADNDLIDSSFVQIPLIVPSPNPNWVPFFMTYMSDENSPENAIKPSDFPQAPNEDKGL